MPVVSIPVEKFSKLLGTRLDTEEASSLLARAGISLQDIHDGVLKAEYNPNRPDFSSIYGVVRTVKGFLGAAQGIPKIKVDRPRLAVKVDRSIQRIRPYIACAVVRGLRLDEPELEHLIAMQEDLHWVLGRNRSKVSIGLHNLEPLKPPFTYTATAPDKNAFIPLKSSRKMTPREILAEHETGRKYAHLVAGFDAYPVLIDSRGEVLSMPPIINGILTELSPGKSDIFIDVTGTDLVKVTQSLKILAAALHDAGGRLEQVTVRYPRQDTVTPDMRPEVMMLQTSLVRDLLGLDLTDSEVAKKLKAMRFGAVSSGPGRLKVLCPAYRVDIMHPVDLVEEVAISYDYGKMGMALPKTQSFGQLLTSSHAVEKLREIMLGLGFTEVLNTLLTNESVQYEKTGLTDDAKRVKIMNPATKEYTTLRTWLLPALLKNLADNQQNLYPQRLFEVGDTIHQEPTSQERVLKRIKLAAVVCHAEASFSEVKGVVEEVFRMAGLKAEFTPKRHPTFIDGRSAEALSQGESLGFLGEVSPRVLGSFGISMPVSAFEMDAGIMAKR